MMRVISGSLKGRNFNTPKSRRVHPMGDKVRGALFNTLGDIHGLAVLDSFAGSGAISFEAISRGAEHVVCVEIDQNAHSTIVNNISSMGLMGKIKAIRANASGWSDNNPDEKFDVVICDPPYDEINMELLNKIANHTKIGGVTVFSLPPTTVFELPITDYQLLANKDYGDATLIFYRKVRCN